MKAIVEYLSISVVGAAAAVIVGSQFSGGLELISRALAQGLGL